MASITAICVYCGSSNFGPQPHRDAAARLGRLIAGAGIRLVFGGGNVGLMGVVAEAAMAAGGMVTGIIPQHLLKVERPDNELTELLVVDSMHVRKEAMFRRSDAFVILPGGLGTLDETFEILTWKQLRLHDKPIVICDLDGYWQPFFALFDHLLESRYMPPRARGFLIRVETVEEVLPALAEAAAPEVLPQPERL